MEAMKVAVAALHPPKDVSGTDIAAWDDDDIDYAYEPRTTPRDVWDFISDEEVDDVDFDSGVDPDHYGVADGSSGAMYGLDWLAARCAEISSRRGLGPNSSPLQDKVIGILSAGGSDNQLQTSLTDLVGFDDLDFVIDLLSHRSELVAAAAAAAGGGMDGGHAEKPQEEPQEVRPGLRLLTRRQREEELRRRDWMHKAAPLAAARAKEEEYPHVYRAFSAGNTLSHAGKRYALPVGSERKEFEKYEEYSIPPGKTGSLLPGERLIAIADLDGLCRNTFRGYKSLNRMQSLVYPVAYETSENLLICAPTGAVSLGAVELGPREE